MMQTAKWRMTAKLTLIDLFTWKEISDKMLHSKSIVPPQHNKGCPKSKSP